MTEDKLYWCNEISFLLGQLGYICVSFDKSVPKMRRNMLSYIYFIIYHRLPNISRFMREMVPRLWLVGHCVQWACTNSGGHSCAMAYLKKKKGTVVLSKRDLKRRNGGNWREKNNFSKIYMCVCIMCSFCHFILNFAALRVIILHVFKGWNACCNISWLFFIYCVVCFNDF